ncbi:tape measure protein [Ottowia sp. SB7-C50]|uniref:tape measure protein n=1 Tax=Ottowia sp. SB7-C50 TaxID=3081231 RepID=UPI002955C1F7|nr:tape measure protein [Ottowia sp. SB7-C50]WOP15767.1 tape measure protein [Ottowia sp. SB7-C50]
MADKSVDLKISVNNAQAKQGLGEVKGALDAVAGKQADVGHAAQEAGVRVGGAAQQQAAAAGRVGGAWQRVKDVFSGFTPATVALGTALGNAVGSIVGRAADIARSFIQANNEIESTRRALTVIYKDGALAQQQIDMLRKLSNEAGIEFSGLTGHYTSFTAAATAANIPLSVQNELFASVTRAGSALGLSSEANGRALLALSQMASKGTVSMEELRGQLGESLPGALSLAAKGLGLTETELIKLVESGGLAARDLFPALAQSLKSMAGENQTASAGWERLKNAINQMFVAVGDGGGMTVLIGTIRVLAGLLGLVLVPLQAFAEVLFGLGRSVGAAAAAIAILTDKGTTWGQKAAALREINDDLSGSFEAAGGRIRASQDAFVAVATGADGAANSLGRAKGSADATSQAASNLAATWTATGMVMAKAAEDAAKQVTNSEKRAQAIKAESDAMVVLARVRGNDLEIAGAEAAAAQANAEALRVVATARSTALEIAEAELTAKKNLIAGSADEQKARAEDIKTLSDKVAKLKEEAGASDQAALAARAASVAALAAAEAKQDHTGKVAQFTKELQQAQKAMLAAAQLDQNDKANAEKLLAAKDQLTLAQAHLNDALADTVAAKRADAVAAKAQAESSITLLESQKQMAATSEQVARLMGNEEAARRYKIEQLQIEIRITMAKADAQRAEAEGSIAVARAAMEELRVKDPLNTVKRAELEASIKVAEAKIRESAAIRDSARSTEMAISNMRNFGNEAGAAGDKSKAATDKASEGWNDVAEAADGATASARRYKETLGDGVERVGTDGYRNKDGWASDAKGNAIGQTKQSWLSIYNQVKGMGLTDEQARGIADKAYPNGKYSAQLQNENSAVGKESVDVTEAARRAAEKLIREGGKGGMGSGTSSSSTAPSKVVRIEFGGRNYDVDTTTSSGQTALENLLRDIGRDKRRAA